MLVVVIAGIVYYVYKKIAEGVGALGDAASDLGAGLFGEGSEAAHIIASEMGTYYISLVPKFIDVNWKRAILLDSADLRSKFIEVDLWLKDRNAMFISILHRGTVIDALQWMKVQFENLGQQLDDVTNPPEPASGLFGGYIDALIRMINKASESPRLTGDYVCMYEEIWLAWNEFRVGFNKFISAKEVATFEESVEDLGAGMFGGGSLAAKSEVEIMNELLVSFLPKFNDVNWKHIAMIPQSALAVKEKDVYAKIQDRNSMYINAFHRSWVVNTLEELKLQIKSNTHYSIIVSGSFKPPDYNLFAGFIEGLKEMIHYASKHIRFAGDYVAMHDAIISHYRCFRNALYRFIEYS